MCLRNIRPGHSVVWPGASQWPMTFDAGMWSLVMRSLSSSSRAASCAADGPWVVKFPTEAYPDAVLVVLILGRVPGMCAVFLLGPSRPDLDVPVRPAAPVVDHEVIAQFVPPSLAMPAAERIGIARFACAVMQYDVPPPALDRLDGPRAGRRGLPLPQPE